MCLSATVHIPEALLPQDLLLQTFNLGRQPRVISLHLIILRTLHRQLGLVRTKLWIQSGRCAAMGRNVKENDDILHKVTQ